MLTTQTFICFETVSKVGGKDMSEHVYERHDECVVCGETTIGMGARNPANGGFHCYDCDVVDGFYVI